MFVSECNQVLYDASGTRSDPKVGISLATRFACCRDEVSLCGGHEVGTMSASWIFDLVPPPSPHARTDRSERLKWT